MLPPPPLNFESVDGRKADGHAPLEEREKVSENGDPLAEYYAQARADLEAQVSRAISYSNGLATHLRAVESRCIGFR